MCGIAGALHADAGAADRAGVARMVRALSPRGPDGEGISASGHAILGHRRLAVVDLSPANCQPMTSADGALVLAYNGEIYNFRELRRELEASGASFRTSGDVEVLLEAYRHWGSACVDRLRGMFAFAVWNVAKRELFLARDRLGEKPLCYWQAPDRSVLLFASDLRSLLQHGRVPKRIDPVAVGHYLSLNYTLGEVGIIEGVRRLSPGCVAFVRPGEALREHRYWSMVPHLLTKTSLSKDDATAKLGELLDDAVRERLVSDVPLGAFLSGGLDSTSVVASMARQRQHAGSLETFNVGFDDSTYDERGPASRAAAALGVRQHGFALTGAHAQTLAAVVSAAGEPIADTALLAFYHLAGLARSQVTVCLSGDGSDEIFAGYPTYLADRFHRWGRALPAGLIAATQSMTARLPVRWEKLSLEYAAKQFTRGLSLSPVDAHLHWRAIFALEEWPALLQPERRAAALARPVHHFTAAIAREVEGAHWLDQMLYLDARTWLADDVLVTTDRMSMAHGLELRAPFLDHRLVEFAASLPAAWKLRGSRGKHLLRESQRGRVPNETLRRRKSGLGIPLARWVAGPMRELLRDAMASAAFREWVRPEAVDALWTEHDLRQRDNGYRLFGLGVLAIWMNEPERPDGSLDRGAGPG